MEGGPSTSAAERTRPAPGSFLSLCRTHLLEASELQQQHGKDLRQASSFLEVANISCRHLSEDLQLAVEQRLAHEYDDTETEKHWGRTRVNYRTFDQNSAESCIQDRLQPAFSMVNPGSLQAAVKEQRTIPSNAEIPPVTKHQDQTLQSAAAVVIQQRWREYRQKCGNARNLSAHENRDDQAKTRSRSVRQDRAATVIQAFWKGFSLRRRLKATLATVTVSDIDEDDFFEDDVFEELDAFFFEQWKVLSGDDVQTSHHPVPQQQKSFAKTPQLLRAPFSRRSREGWVDAEQVEPEEWSVSSVSFTRSESPTSDVNSLSKTSKEIMEEWGFTHTETALLMLKRAQKMKSQKLQQKKDPCVQVTLANCNLQMTPNRKTQQHNTSYRRVGKAELGLQQARRKVQAQHWLHTQTLQWESDSEGFLPEIHGESANRGRARRWADQGHTEHPHQVCGSSSNSSSTVRSQKQNSHPSRNSVCRARPKEVTSAPSKMERTSFRDNPVRLSGGWGRGRKKTP